MKTKYISLMIVLAWVTLFSACMANGASNQNDDQTHTLNSSKTGQCYIINDCKKVAYPEKMTMEQCIAQDGSSWKDEKGACISSINQKK